MCTIRTIPYGCTYCTQDFCSLLFFLHPESTQLTHFERVSMFIPRQNLRRLQRQKKPKITPQNYSITKRRAIMPRMSQKRKQELSLFLNERGRVEYNILCRRCVHTCKQAYKVMVVECGRYLSKRAKEVQEKE